jgi:uncharacterized membrane protein
MAEDRLARETLDRLIERLDSLERLMAANSARLYAIERRLGLAERDEAALPNTAPAPEVVPAPGPMPRAEQFVEERRAHGHEVARVGADRREAAEEQGQRAATATDGGRRGAAETFAETEYEPEYEPPTKRDFEAVVGGNWFNWIGIVAVTFGVAFFLKLAIDNDWIGPGGRVSLGAAAGLGMLALGERLRGRGLRQYAYVLSGGGVLILYLSIYAAFNFYKLVSQPIAFILMAGVTAGTVLLSVRLNALPVAVLGLIGGFLTPVLLSTGLDNQAALFVYVALLDAGVLAVAYFKRWNSLNFLSFFATALMTFGWLIEHYSPEKLWTTLFFASLLFLLYSLLAVVHNLLPRRPARWFDLLLVSANATLYYSLVYGLLIDEGYERRLPATAAVIVSALFVLLFYAAWRLNRAERLLAYTYVAAAVTFFTVALGIQYELHWVTVAWAVEGMMLTWAGLRAGEPSARRAALFIFALAALHWLGWDLPDSAFREGAAFVPLLNRRALSCAALVAALASAVWLYRREGARGRLSEGEREAAASALGLAAHALGLALLTFDLNDYFAARGAGAGASGLREGVERADNARMFSFTVLWGIYGAGLLAYGARRGRRALRYAGVLLLGAATVGAVAGALPYYDAPWHVPVFNPTFAAFALLVALYFYAARLYTHDAALPEEERMVVPALVVIANVLAVVALSAEASGYFEARVAAARAQLPPAPTFAATPEEYSARVAEYARLSQPLRDLELARQLSLSIIWALYGAGLLVVGRLRRARLLRLMALALLGLTTLKVFFFDLASLDRVYRIISFIALGLVLLTVSYLYQRSQQQQRAPLAEEESTGD